MARRRVGAGRRRVALVLRTVLLTALVLALAGFRIVLPVDRLATVFVVDMSDSVGNAGRDSGTRLDTGPLMMGNRSLTGVFLGAESMLQPQRVQAMVAGHLKDIAAGGLKVVVDRTFPLAEAASAHAYIESRASFGRVLLVP